jgi:hypothetical protein
MARWGATDDELRRHLPGDDLIAGSRPTVTNVVTVDAPPEQVWPWIVQIGRGRAGFYTYTWIENLLGADIHNLDRIDPNLQALAIGDRIWLTPDPYLGRLPGQAWRVRGVDHSRSFTFFLFLSFIYLYQDLWINHHFLCWRKSGSTIISC